MGEDSADKVEALTPKPESRLSQALSELFRKFSGGTKEGGQHLMSVPEVNALMEEIYRKKLG